MRLRFLGTSSENGDCPAAYETSGGTVAIQGKLILDPRRSATPSTSGRERLSSRSPARCSRSFRRSSKGDGTRQR